jgi:hypothetical protein
LCYSQSIVTKEFFMQKIASALVKAQKSFGPALKSSTNPHFRSKYADLSACVEAVIDGLNENGIALIQIPHECESGVTVETLFIHESGETLSAGKLHVPASKQDAQGYGSALTYARRYSLMAACGIAPEDDDGNAATKRPPAPAVRAETTVAGYAEYEAQHLETLQAAAMNGAAALGEAFGALAKTPQKAQLWAKHGLSLKDAAAKIDSKKE